MFTGTAGEPGSFRSWQPARSCRADMISLRASAGSPSVTHCSFGTRALSKARALADIAQALAATDPDRAVRLLTEAARMASSITDPDSKPWALRSIAQALATTDPDRAERIASSITDKSLKASALADIAQALAARPS